MRENERRLRKHAKIMRREMTKAEIVLWNRLRELNLRGYEFRRQHPISPFIADFVHLAGMLVIEIDGGTHVTEVERAYDARREDVLHRRGWTVVRYRNEDVYSDVAAVLDDIVRRLGPHPNGGIRRSTSPVNGRG